MYDTTIDVGLKNEEGFRLLAEQKRELIELIDKGRASDKLEGLVNFIDHIQDECVDTAGVPDEIVFPFKEKA